MSASAPRVSVIVPNYNHARFLPRRIDSILGQTFQDFELILLDDCSTDDSRSTLSQYAGDPRVRIEFNAVNSGSTFKQWNKGARLANGKYIWFAESDDYTDPRMLERLVRILDSHPDVAFAYCRSWQVRADDSPAGFADWYLEDLHAQRWTTDFFADGYAECQKYFIYDNQVPNASSVVFRKAAYEAVGGADEGLRMCGDWKLWASIALTGRVAYLSEPLNYFRLHDESVRGRDRSHLLVVEETLEVIRWILDRVTVEDQEQLCEKLAGRWLRVLVTIHIPFHRARSIYRKARAIDPHAMRRLIYAYAFYLGLPILNITRPIRHRFRTMRKAWVGRDEN